MTDTTDTQTAPRDPIGQFTEYKNSFPEVALTGLVVNPAAGGPDTVTVAELMDADPRFWLGLAEDEDTPLAILRVLGRSDNPRVRASVAQNYAINDELHEQLSQDEDGEVRAATIDNQRTGAEFLTRFDFDTDDDVAAALGANKLTAGHRLRSLYADEVSREALSLYHFASNPSCPADLLVELSTHANPRVRMEVLNNRSVTAETVNQLSTDVEFEVRARVPGHPLVTIETLRALAHDPSDRVRLAVARSHGIDQAIAMHLSADPSAAVRKVIAAFIARS
jgi:hypothetical protein